jgi:hypothetical protein
MAYKKLSALPAITSAVGSDLMYVVVQEGGIEVSKKITVQNLSGSAFSGYSGYSGHSGYVGISGFSGFSGISGFSGHSGYNGTDGYSGYSGVSGFSGSSGHSGYSGFSGHSGLPGAGIVAKGAWDAFTPYNVNDMVRYEPGNWVSIQDANTGNVPEDGAWWTTFSNVGVAGEYTQGFTNADLFSGILNVPHFLGRMYPVVQMSDNNNMILAPDDVEFIDANNLTIDVSSFGVISGSWHVSVTTGGGSAGPEGMSGYSGWSGDNPGSSGYSGASGISGYSGYSGSGTSGYSGYSGSGVSGYSGYSGTNGSSGYSGFSGFSGVSGFSGTSVMSTPAVNQTASGLTSTLTAQANVVFGDVCYINSSGNAQLIDADSIVSMGGLAMCADASITAGNSGNWLMIGFARNDSWNWTVGGTIYGTVIGTSGNTLSQTAPVGTNRVVQVLGVATNSKRVFFNPQLVQIELA